MRLLKAFSVGACILGLVEALPRRASSFAKRQVTELRDEYDFVVVGAGTAGLTVANRVSAAFPKSMLLNPAPSARDDSRGLRRGRSGNSPMYSYRNCSCHRARQDRRDGRLLRSRGGRRGRPASRHYLPARRERQQPLRHRHPGYDCWRVLRCQRPVLRPRFEARLRRLGASGKPRV